MAEKNPTEIHNALQAVRDAFPKSSKVVLRFVHKYSEVSAFDSSVELGAVSSMMNAWQLENKPPTATFSPTDDSVVDFAKSVANRVQTDPCKMLIVIDLQHNQTTVHVTPNKVCFIATATYGSPVAQQVMALSRFRDEVLLQAKAGRMVVRLYYFLSPPIAMRIEERERVKAGVRIILSPLLFLVKIWMQLRK